MSSEICKEDFELMILKIPHPKDKHTADFCKKINSQSKPILVEIKSNINSEVSNCFNNVKQFVEESGGRIQFGWSIWEWPRVFIEAEHHAVYVDLNGSLIDLTPDVDNLTERLFLPDDRAIYDFNNEGIYRDNYRKALIKDQYVEIYIRLAQERIQILNKYRGLGNTDLNMHDSHNFRKIEGLMVEVGCKLGMKYTHKNDKCFCGSSIKFKKCHGKYQ